MANEINNQIESRKLWADYIKHLTTLSTGSLVLISTFLEKIFSKPLWKGALVTSLAGFLASVLGGVFVFSLMTIESLYWEDGQVPEKLFDKTSTLATIATWLGFFAGISGLTAFTIRNILAP